MKTVKCNSANEIIIKISRFITLLFKIYDGDDITSIFDKVKEEYPKATHIVMLILLRIIKKQVMMVNLVVLLECLCLMY